MNNVYEFGIVGMGPAGIGAALRLQNAKLLKEAICFDLGDYSNQRVCGAWEDGRCYQENKCQIITGLGGSSSNSSGKISRYPAGSRLAEFFDSVEQLDAMMLSEIHFLDRSVGLNKDLIMPSVIDAADKYYTDNGIKYKYYETYSFDGNKYRGFLDNCRNEFEQSGMRIQLNTEVISIEYVSDASLYMITAHNFGNNANIVFYVQNVILAVGAAKIDSKLIPSKSSEMSFELGLRLESDASVFAQCFSAHGDLKLKYDHGRTYCASPNGRIVSYYTDGYCFLEGNHEQSEPTNFSNLAVLIRYDKRDILSEFLERYRSLYHCMPIMQRYADYMQGTVTKSSVQSTLSIAKSGNIMSLFPEDVNTDIRAFLAHVVEHTMQISPDELVLVAPELKLLYRADIDQNFMCKPGFYIIGSATGRFRGILQSLCSGVRCVNNILRR